MRIAPITGRVDDMLIVKGVNFFPKQVEQALMEIPGVGSNYQIIIEETDGVRDVTVNVEAEPHVTGYMVEKALKEALGFQSQGRCLPDRRAAPAGRQGQTGVLQIERIEQIIHRR